MSHVELYSLRQLTYVFVACGGIFLRLWASTQLGAKKGEKKEEKTRWPQTPEISGDIIEVLLQCTGGTFGIITPTEAPSQVVTIRM